MTVPENNDSYLLQSNVTQRSLMAVGGKGTNIFIEEPGSGDRKTLIDGCTGAAVGALGHGDADIVKEIVDASTECVYTFPSTVCNYYAEDLAKFIIDNSPKNAYSAAVFVGSGSEANENAMRIARQYFLEKGDTDRVKFISRDQSYHGFTTGCLGIGGGRRFDPYRPICQPLDHVPKATPCNPYHNKKNGETLEQYKDRLLEELDETFQKAGPSTVAGAFLETVSGSSLACQTPVPGYLEGARAICHKYGALYISDEVMCGMGRCGTYHAWQQFLPEGQYPDIQTIGKTLGSGFVTIAGVLVSPKVKNAIASGSKTIPGAQTYHCHSFNCRIALAVQKKVKEQSLVENSFKMGEYLAEKLESAIGSHKYVGDLRGAGLFRGIEFVKDKTTKTPFDPSVTFAKRFMNTCYKNGLTVMGNQGSVDGIKGDISLICPAYILDKAVVDGIVEIVSKSLDELTLEVDAE
ncbi:hypothetical protein OGAPHI_005805 [Ogataea philodendri]|uniref:Aminotransferase n=1 Tax=Ogataea philodendri TaxID=1378263 RepID=A0A9P8T194_9ASCO|nr:uncharacterized protein OGAPHI_005805 [Ogataea philodendri]KAH3662553.1 hypothetical protein OGAPHI_005805 [Ogataea philodendri]